MAENTEARLIAAVEALIERAFDARLFPAEVKEAFAALDAWREERRPKRIQRKRAKGWRMPPNTVYVGRGLAWGNPYRVGTCLIPDAETAVGVYRANLPLRFDCSDLRGKNLACWCALDQPCHADVLLEIANAPVPGAGVVR